MAEKRHPSDSLPEIEMSLPASHSTDWQLDVALNNMMQGLAMFDPEFRLVICNRRYREIYGYPESLAKPGANLRDLITHNVSSGIFQPIELESAIRERFEMMRSSVPRTLHRHLSDGRIIELFHQSLPNGYTVLTYTDITEREQTQASLRATQEGLRERVAELEAARLRLEEQSRHLAELATNLARARDEAEAANRTKSEFLANMSHELRTPLNAVIGFSELMMAELFGPLGDARYLDYSRDIHDSGKHLLVLINDILDLSKIEAGKLELREETVDLQEVSLACERLVRERAHLAGVHLSAPTSLDLPLFRGDSTKLKQILLNLLSNAIKFTPAGGFITVSIGTNDKGPFLSVSDTGIGMQPEDIPTALKPFQQIENSIARQYEGTGLGLPLTDALARLHGGSLAIESAPGKGTTVIVQLPRERIIQSTLADTR